MTSQKLLQVWQTAKPLITQGYTVLNKEVTMGIPCVSFPASDQHTDTGIGSPFGRGAEKIAYFFEGIVHKVMLTPQGETFPPAYSPYTGTLGYNPFFIPLEKTPFLGEKTLKEIYASSIKGVNIDYKSVAKNYHKALTEIYQNYQKALANKDTFALSFAKDLQEFKRAQPYLSLDIEYYHKKDKDFAFFTQFLASTFTPDASLPYIGDIPVKIPDSYAAAFPNLFLKGFSLGTPPDSFSKQPRNWGFPVLDPAKIFNPDGTLGKGGQLLQHIFASALQRNKGGLRIDHFIGFVDPYLISENPKYENGRLYSSPSHPILGKYAKTDINDFARLAFLVIDIASENHIPLENLYIEDIGNRPAIMDEVLKLTGLGRMLVSQFVEPENPTHLYRLKNANPNDIAVLNTHDMESVQHFFKAMPEEERKAHARTLTEDLRFNPAPDLAQPKNLVRMKWAELMASPARRTMAFFTSFTGQDGRFNQPHNPKKWQLRCTNNFEDLYFKNLKAGLAYNPFDAICLGIWAKGDKFFGKNEELVRSLRTAESNLLAMI